MTAPKPLKSLYGARERPQEIYTPEYLLAPLRKLWGTIELDPCSGPDSIVGAREAWTEGGLDRRWRDRTYVNPPFKYLKEWLGLALVEGTLGSRVALLAPARGHRKWFRAAAHVASTVVDLDPVKFVGYPSTFPAPLCLLYWGKDWEALERAYEDLGDPR
jgi:hypothetical protein